MAQETLYANGALYTLDATNPHAEAMLVRGDRIAAVGSWSFVRSQASADAEIIDLQGRFAMPAFIDSHVHFAWGSKYLNEVQLREAKTFGDVLARLKAYSQAHPDRTWIVGSEFSYGYPDLPEGGFHKSLLDQVVADRPVFFRSGMAHAAWVNSKALELAGITRDTPDPEGGEIVRDASGEPTGWLKERAWSQLETLVPQSSKSDMRAALLRAIKEANRLGLSRVQSAGMDDEAVPVLAEIFANGELSLRFTLSSIVNPDSNLGDVIARVSGWRNELDPAFLDGRVIKFFLDGVLESHTGFMPQGYADKPGETGTCLWEASAYNAAVSRAQQEGFQVWTHAIGTGAIEMALDAYAADGERSRRCRPRVEHCEIPTAHDIERFGRIGAIASFQPAMIYPRDQWLGMEGLWEVRVGSKSLSRAFPVRSILEAVGAVAFGTDWPIVDLNPLVGIRNAVLRQSLDHQPKDGWVPEQRITVAQALNAYTLGAAFAAHRETDEGSLATGKLADFVVLSEDPLRVEPDKIADIKVLKTIVGGKSVWEEPAT
ncbi:amidohydrolase [Mesorhizobium dulcispinae]|uniref:amidohydrolase n=1 Tax=Mesorhizobium dulcispinae TaxID=3072316 RepID=UPI002A241F53|nr:amidohydrolase [Mesorhizobium sp. VK23D]MDX8516621.1 amidohydrolase [Mesorhizobium sp. VK23D]